MRHARGPADERWVTPLWLSHHYPEDYDRCVRVGRSHVCRRCLALYPATFAVMLAVLALVGGPVDAAWSTMALVLLPLPAVVEFVLEHLGRIRYQPVRQVALTLVMAVGMGVGLARYLRHPADPVFWGVVMVYGGACGASALSGRRPSTR